MAQQPLYKSEVFIPIKKDTQSFEQRQRNIWDDMHERMEQRRRMWETEVDKMRKDFFCLKPNDKRRGSSENLLDTRDINDIFYDDSKKPGDKTFRVSFDVSQFTPDEISVRTQDQKLVVHAKHEGFDEGRNVSREFSRQVDIPRHVNAENLQCTLSNDGILQIEASVPAPAYNRIEQNSATPQLSANPAGFSTASFPSQGHGKGFSAPAAVIFSTAPPGFTSTAHVHTGSHASGPIVQGQPMQSGPITTEEDGSKKFKISVDVGSEFLPQDVMVKTVDKKLLVNAKHEEKAPGRSSCKEFSREFDLPEDVDPNLVTASMTDDGKLLVEAPISSYTHGTYAGKPGSTKQPRVYITMRK